MSNRFSSTDDFISSLAIVKDVGRSLTEPKALKPSQLPITNAVCCGTVVLISGYFESFLKDLIRQYIEAINALAKPVTDIPLNMHHIHFSGGANALKWISKKDKELKNTTMSQDFSLRLASLSNSSGSILAWESFADTQSNPGADVLAKLMSGMQITDGWKSINDLTQCHGSLDVFLKTFMKIRNICAHTGSHNSPPTGSDILDYAEKFEAIGECLDMVLALRLLQFH